MLDPKTILQNRYLIVKQLAKGGMGAVYEAIDERLDITVALKETFFTDERLRKQFEREARLLARLRHPAITKVIDHFAEGEGQFLVMEYIPGDDLSTMLIRKRGAFSPEEVLEWGDQLLGALDYLHTQEPPVIHRDIKPQNLKLTTQGQIILLDFGLAKGFAGQISRVTTSGSIFGYTPNYAPLEQIQGEGTEARSDLYSLGGTLYHLMTGASPPDVLSRLAAVSDGQPDVLRPAHEVNPRISEDVSELLKKAMSISRRQRHASAAEMREELRAALRSSVSVSRSSTSVESAGAQPTMHTAQTLTDPPAREPARVPTPERVPTARTTETSPAPPAPQPLPVEDLKTRPIIQPRAQTVKGNDAAPATTKAAPTFADDQPPRQMKTMPKWLPLVIGGVAGLVVMGVLIAIYASGNRSTSNVNQPAPADTSPAPAASTLIVSQAGGGQYRTVGDALKAAALGTRILVRPGVYKESLTLDKNVEIVGDGAVEQIIVESSGASCLTMQTDRATVRGLTLRAHAAPRTSSIPNDGVVHYSTIAFTPNIQSRIPIQEGSRPRIAPRQRPTVPRQRPKRSRPQPAAGNAARTTATPSPATAADLAGDGYPAVDISRGQLVLEDCDISADSAAVIAIHGAQANPVIRRCKIHGGTTGVSVTQKGAGTIEDCDIFENVYGVGIDDSNNATFRQSRINRNSEVAVFILTDSKAKIENCDLTGNKMSSWKIIPPRLSAVERTGNTE